MKILIYILMATLSFSSTFANPITVTVVFENHTDKTTISGVFYITETNRTFEISSLDTFTFELPKKGKYEFGFHSEEVNAFTSYPARITNSNNIVTIRLEKKTVHALTQNSALLFPFVDISDFTVEQMEEGIAMGTINFIVHGLIAPDPEMVKTFKTIYDVGFISENCVVDPISFKTAMQNNKKIEAFLNSKFGNAWRNELPTTPFGL